MHLSCNSASTGTPVSWHPRELGNNQAMLGLIFPTTIPSTLSRLWSWKLRRLLGLESPTENIQLLKF